MTQKVIADKQCGRIRTIPVSIVNAATGEKIDDCPEPHALKELLDDLWQWLKEISARGVLRGTASDALVLRTGIRFGNAERLGCLLVDVHRHSFLARVGGDLISIASEPA